jgi:hypothetical protein
MSRHTIMGAGAGGGGGEMTLFVTKGEVGLESLDQVSRVI